MNHGLKLGAIPWGWSVTSIWWKEEEKPATPPTPDFKYVSRIYLYFLSKQTCVNNYSMLHFSFSVCPSKKLCLRLNQCLRRLWDKCALLSALQIWWFVTWAAAQVTTHSSSSPRWSAPVAATIWWGSNSSSMIYQATISTVSSNQLNSSRTHLQHITREKDCFHSILLGYLGPTTLGFSLPKAFISFTHLIAFTGSLRYTKWE